VGDEKSWFEGICSFLEALRVAARTGGELVLPPHQVRVLLCDEVYTLLSRLEAQMLRNGRSEDLRARVVDAPTMGGGNAIERPATSDSAVVCRPNELAVARPNVEDLISEWLKFHVSRLAAPDRYHYSAAHLKRFFDDERRCGRLGENVTVKI
jgi:hypothetical protein